LPGEFANRLLGNTFTMFARCGGAGATAQEQYFVDGPAARIHQAEVLRKQASSADSMTGKIGPPSIPL